MPKFTLEELRLLYMLVKSNDALIESMREDSYDVTLPNTYFDIKEKLGIWGLCHHLLEASCLAQLEYDPIFKDYMEDSNNE